MERYQKLWNILVLGPLLLVPILAVEFPRVVAFMPVVSLITGGVLLKLSKTQFNVPRSALIIVPLILAFLWLSAIAIAPSEVAVERVSKLSLVAVVGTLFLSVLYAGRIFSCPMFTKLLLGSCSIAACFICAEVLMDAPVYKIFRPDVDPKEYTMSVFNRGSLVVTFTSLLTLYLERHTRHKAFYLMYLPVIAMLFIVESQSAQIAVICGLIFFFFFPISFKWAWRVLFLLLVVGSLSAPFAVQKIYEQIPESVNDHHMLQTAYVGNRIEIWDFISRKALEKPLFGNGIEYTKGCTDFTTEKRFLKSNIVLHPHSSVLQIWIELGFVGIVGFLALSGFFFKRAYELKSAVIRKASLSIASLVFLVSCFSYGLWQGWWLGLMFVLAGIVLSQSSRFEHKA